MTRREEKLLTCGLWVLYAVLVSAGMTLLIETLFIPRSVPVATLENPRRPSEGGSARMAQATNDLAGRRFTRHIAKSPPPIAPVKAPVSLDTLIKLTGIMDFGSQQPALAVIETAGETKAYKAGDKIGETGASIKDIGEYVIVEFDRRRFKATFASIQEIPASAVKHE